MIGLASIFTLSVGHAQVSPVDMQNWETRCIGRYFLIAPPFSATSGKDEAIYRGAKITRAFGAEVEKMARRFRRHEQSMREHAAELGGEAFVRRQQVGDKDILVTSWIDATLPKRLDYQLYAPRPAQGAAYLIEYDQLAEEGAQSVPWLIELIGSIQPHEAGKLPTRTGFCMQGAFIPDDGLPKEYENGSITILQGERTRE